MEDRVKERQELLAAEEITVMPIDMSNLKDTAATEVEHFVERQEAIDRLLG